jgi:hypothetical protein
MEERKRDPRNFEIDATPLSGMGGKLKFQNLKHPSRNLKLVDATMMNIPD